MNPTVIPTPYPSIMGGNTATYESTPAPKMKGGKRRRQSKRAKKSRTYRKNQRSRKQRR